jgi:hypothetical protein
MRPLKKETASRAERGEVLRGGFAAEDARSMDEDALPPNGKAMANDPLAEDVILEQFYRPAPAAPSSIDKKAKPTHYKIVCISLYNEDIERLEKLVQELKKRGHTKANKSQVIRAALDQIDLAKVPKGY